jgi:outer membrane receptor for ferrienterochelin and colicin
LGDLSYAEAQGFVDANATWHVTDSVDVYTAMTNLTNEVRIDRRADDSLVQTNENGRRLFAGVRVKF